MAVPHYDVAVVGSGYAGSLLARILATQGYQVALLERGVHPRFAIGESSTPLANLTLERLSRRYGLPDLYQLAAHGRWVRHHPSIRRGLKRGFTFYRHWPGRPFVADDENANRLLVAASPDDAIADTHWLRADLDHYLVRQAVAAGVDYRDRVSLTSTNATTAQIEVRGERDGRPVDLRATMLIDASGPGGFLARHLGIRSQLRRTATRAGLLFSHFENVRLFADVAGDGLSPGPFPDDWAAMHHIIDEGWMYSLRFDHGVVSAGFLLSPRGLARMEGRRVAVTAESMWKHLTKRYPSIALQFGDALPLFPLRFRPRIQHRLERAAGARWALLPHAYAFVDPLFSTGIAWGLRAIERLALAFEETVPGSDRPIPATVLRRYDAMLAAEADQIDQLVAGAYDAMVSFDLVAAHAMLYFATVSFAEARQRLREHDGSAWDGFLGVGDPVLGTLPREARRRLRAITEGGTTAGTSAARRRFVEWTRGAIAPRNVAGLADPTRRNLYPVDLDLLVNRHELLGMSREELIAGLPRLRGAAEASTGPPAPA